MAIKKFKPTSPALREMTVFISDEVTTNQPEKSLLVPLKKNSGRNVHGKITVRHRGGGNRRKYRIIDFKALCTACFIALLKATLLSIANAMFSATN